MDSSVTQTQGSNPEPGTKGSQKSRGRSPDFLQLKIYCFYWHNSKRLQFLLLWGRKEGSGLSTPKTRLCWSNWISFLGCLTTLRWKQWMKSLVWDVCVVIRDATWEKPVIFKPLARECECSTTGWGKKSLKWNICLQMGCISRAVLFSSFRFSPVSYSVKYFREGSKGLLGFPF